MELTFSADLTASLTERTITGKIVPIGSEVGFTSAGKVVFERNSIQISDPKSIKLLDSHNRQKALGRAQSFNETEDAIYATFKVSNSTRGTDALILAEEGLQSGLSVGVEVLTSRTKGDVLHVTSAKLNEVSLVTEPAFKSAQVTEIAAEESDAQTIEPTKESEAILDQVTPDTATPEVEAPAVEASRPTVTAAVAYTAPRIELTKEKYLENSIKASLGDDDARQYIKAAAASTANNSGLIPTRQLTEVINPLANADRPFINSISQGTLPDAGMSFEIPKITQVPVVAETAEGAAPADQNLADSYLSVSVKKYAGQQTFSLELLDRSSPAFYAELVKNMEYAYAKATDTAVGSALINGGTDGGNRTMSAANLLDFISDAAVSIYTNTLGFAQNVIVSPEQWGAIMGLVDSTNRAIYTATQPVNAGGVVSVTSLRGNVNGLNLYVSRSISGTGDNSIIVVNPDSYTWYESPTFKLEANLINTGQVNVGYFGYGAIATKVAAGAYKWMVA